MINTPLFSPGAFLLSVWMFVCSVYVGFCLGICYLLSIAQLGGTSVSQYVLPSGVPGLTIFKVRSPGDQEMICPCLTY